MVITQIENGKIATMDFSTMWEYQNSDRVYLEVDEAIVMRILV